MATGPLDGVCLVRPAGAPPSPATETPASVGPSLDCRILLAEDSPDNRQLVSFVLGRAGAEVALACDGSQAIAMALAAQEEGRPYDVIVMDMQMPVLDGYAATRRLRDQGYSGRIIALTAHALRDDLDKCLAAGCDDYSTKPIDSRLIELIARHVARPEHSVP